MPLKRKRRCDTLNVEMKKQQQDIRKDQIRKNEPDGMRLNKFLADAGVCSRREADRLVEAGRVLVDGCPAELGQRVLKGQRVEVDGSVVKPEERLVLLALNKPAGVECTTDRSNPDNIVDFVNYGSRVFPIGRLDKQSTGLILLTNLGELSDKILRGSNRHEKEYVVQVDRPLTEAFLTGMRSGVPITIENENRTVTTRPCTVEQTGKFRFTIVLTQGFNRQIRRMCRVFGFEVTALKRVRILNIRLGDLAEGQVRPVTEAELETLLLQLKEPAGRKRRGKNVQPK